MRFTLEIRCDNSAFDGDSDAELARILVAAAIKIRNGQTRQTLRDSNGNRVGECGLEAGR